MRHFIVLLIVLIALAPSTALADRTDRTIDVDQLVERLERAPDWRIEYAKLSDEEQAEIDRYVTEGEITEEVGAAEPLPDPRRLRKGGDTENGVSLQSGGCWERAYTRKLTNWLGVEMWRFTQYIYWCGNGSWLDQYPSSWINIDDSMFWQWGGIVDSNFYGGYGYNGYRAYRQGYFKYCPLPVGCMREDKPYIYQQGMADGAYYRWGDGGSGGRDW